MTRHDPTLPPKFVHIRRSGYGRQSHWSITVPRAVIEKMGWQKSGFRVAGLVWIDIGMKDIMLVASVYDEATASQIERLKERISSLKAAREP